MFISESATSVVDIATLSVLMPIVLRFVDYLRHLFRRWRQTANVRRIVHNGVSKILNPPQWGKSTNLGQIGDPVLVGNRVDMARREYFRMMISNLEVVLEYYSSDLPYDRKNYIKNLCSDKNRIIEIWQNIKKQYPPKDLYEAIVIDKLRKTKWLKLKR